MNYQKLIKFCRLTLSLISLIVVLPLTAQTSSKNIPCCGVSEAQSAFPHHREELRTLQSSDTRAIPNDNILRLYRLAIPIDYLYLKQNFNGNVEEAKKHWDMLEKHLNRIFQRDFGIAFELVRDNNLIRATQDKAVFNWKDSRYIVENGTTELNKIINSDSYDIAIWLADFNDNRGIASLSGAFNKTKKGNATATTTNLGTTAHEIAHLFGASHTGTIDTQMPSHHSDPGKGTSLMGYDFHDMDYNDMFFSLVTIDEVRRKLSKCGYYTNKERSTSIPSDANYTDYDNYPIGISNVAMRPTAFHLEQVKKTYRITKETALCFNFPAYSDAQDYTYAVHQNDRSRTLSGSKAKLEPLPWTSTPVIHSMLPVYNIFRADYTESHTRQMTGLPVGNYKILMGAVENLGNNQAKEYKRSLDAVEAQLEVVEGIPFRITSALRGQKLKAGENVTLTWNIDKSVYSEQEKVRIWLSDDYGKTYKYLVVDEAPNTGSHTFKVPEISVGAVSGVHNKMQGKGIFLIEVKGHIACATTDYRPSGTEAQGGGFTIEASRNTLQPYVHTYLERGSNPNQPKPEVPKTYKVTLVQSDGGTISINNANLNAIAKGTRLEVSVQTQDGYKLKSIKANEVDITTTKAFVVNADTRVVAVFEKIEVSKHKVTLEYNEGGTISINNTNLDAVAKGTRLTVSVQTQNGYRLKSIKANEVDITTTKEFVVNTDTRVVALFEKIEVSKHKVTLVQGEGGTISISNINLDAVPKGTRLTVSVQTQDGYRLKSIKANEVDITADKTFVVDTDTRVVALFEKSEVPKPKTYTITLRYNPNEGELSIDQENPNAVPEGTSVRVSAKAKEGYQLTSLKAGNKDILEARSFVVNENTEVVAVFAPVPPTSPTQPTKPETGTEETDTDDKTNEEIKVYPTVFTSTLQVAGHERIKRILIYDLMGRKVQAWDTAPEQLNLGDLMPNIYLVVLYPKDGTKAISFKVQKR